MNAKTTITLLAATALTLASVSAVAQGSRQGQGARAPDRAQIERGQKDFDRDRLRDRDRITTPERDRDRDQDRTHVPDNAKLGENGIYGGELMSVEERSQYREKLRLTESDPKARSQFMAQHEEKMETRAKLQGVQLGSTGLGPKYGDGLYGGNLMSVEERNQYREQLRLTESDPEARTKLIAQHQEKMQARAKTMGVKIVEMPEVEEAE